MSRRFKLPEPDPRVVKQAFVAALAQQATQLGKLRQEVHTRVQAALRNAALLSDKGDEAAAQDYILTLEAIDAMRGQVITSLDGILHEDDSRRDALGIAIGEPDLTEDDLRDLHG